MVFLRENPIKKWMMTRGTSILGNRHTEDGRNPARYK
jgi:hypothetical protein